MTAPEHHHQTRALADQALIRSILDANSDSAKVLDLMGDMEILNVSSLKALEVDDAAALVGQPWASLWPAAAQVVIEAALRRARKGHGMRFSTLRPTKAGTPKWWDVRISPIVDEDGVVTRLLVITRDITELHRIQIEAVDANAQLKTQLDQALLERAAATEALGQGEKLQAVGQLVGGVAHDFNNLLQVISGGAELLRTSSLTAERKDKVLAGIITAAQHARTLTERLLAFSHRDVPETSVFDLNTRLSGTIEMLERTLASGILVRTELSEAACRVEADVSQFEIAVLNLVVNARDAMPTGGTLTIQTSLTEKADGVFACLRVSDTGQGMPPEVKAQIFDPYFTTKAVGKGTGLGLPQVIDFVRLSGGHIEVETAVGQGSSFLLFLPCTVALEVDQGG